MGSRAAIATKPEDLPLRSKLTVVALVVAIMFASVCAAAYQVTQDRTTWPETFLGVNAFWHPQGCACASQ